ncbi:hypothetical protein ACO0LB_03590 [Undibacterium sp. SXout7W]|uniref:hypothetical protein n=1 Tax=Undibacterium sp. SXout7W TaxID=3413049 RepID=UPI003BF0DBFA
MFSGSLRCELDAILRYPSGNRMPAQPAATSVPMTTTTPMTPMTEEKHLVAIP